LLCRECVPFTGTTGCQGKTTRLCYFEKGSGARGYKTRMNAIWKERRGFGIS